MDHHDDVIVWRDPPDGSIECIQVKRKRAGNWTTARLIKRDRGTLSPLGKLYHHVLYFGDGVSTLHFISNAAFSVGTLTDGSDSRNRVRIQCRELCAEELDKIRRALKDEHDLDYDPAIEGLLVLSKSDVPITAYEDHTLSRVTRLLERLASGAPIRPSAAYTALMGEVERRAALEADTLPPGDAYRQKMLSRHQVSEMLEDMTRSARADPWPAMASGLERSGWTALRINRTGRAYRSLVAKRTLSAGRAIDEAIAKARSSLEALPDSTDAEVCLTVIVDHIRSERMLGLADDEIVAAAAEVLYGV